MGRGFFNTLHFETTVDGGTIAGLGAGGGGTIGPEPTVEPEAGGWSGISEDQWNDTQELLAQQSQMLEQLAPVAQHLQPPQMQQPDQLRPPDPFSETYGEDFQRYMEARDAQQFAPYQQMLAQQRLEDLEASARDIISDVEQTNGELLQPAYDDGQKGLDNHTLMLELAKSYAPHFVSQYGEGVRADEAAVQAAYERMKSYQSALLAAAEQRQRNQMQALRQAPTAPASSGVAAEPAVTTQPGGWDNFRVRHNLV